MLTGQNGILNRASDAKEKTEESSKEEQRKLAQAEALMSTEKTTYKGVTLPEGFAPTKIDGEDSVDDGLVITDGYGNEYVWVEVPKILDIYKTTGLNISNFTEDVYIKIETDLRSYISKYRPNENFKDVYYENDTDGWFENEEEYNNEKNRMLKSIYLNGGFFVGRYEAGISVNREISKDTTEVPVSKANMYPYTYVTRTQAKVLAEKVKSGSYTSGLIFGLQWDLILTFLCNTGNIDYDILLKKSTTIGNYYDSKFILKRGRFALRKDLLNWHEFNSNEKSDFVYNKIKNSQTSFLEAILLTTGATETSKLQNIYDIAGNVGEWTLEGAKIDGEIFCVSRGGDFGDKGEYVTACSRASRKKENKESYVGFRVVMY